MQITFGKAQPTIAIEFACLVEFVRQQVKDQNLTV